MAKQKAKQSPAKARAAMVAARLGNATGSAVLHLQNRFSTPESLEEFLNWRKDPVTMAMIGAIQELGLAPELGSMDSVDPAVSFGLSQGCALCATLLDDPSRVFEWLFLVPTPGYEGEGIPTDYVLAPDADMTEEDL